MIKPTPLNRGLVIVLGLAYLVAIFYLAYFSEFNKTPVESLPWYYWFFLAVIPLVFISPVILAGKMGSRKPREIWRESAGPLALSLVSIAIALTKSQTQSNEGGSIALLTVFGITELVLVLLAVGGWKIRVGIFGEKTAPEVQ
jgi:peptidoglycan/LPS O-acetylase OafA/YrhL